MKKTLLILSVVLAVSCASTKSITNHTPTQTDADRLASKYPGVTVTELSEGKMQFEANCSKCHALKNPASKNEGQWASIVPKMSAKANKKAGKEVIDAVKQEAILRYLVAASSYKKG